MTGLYRKMRIAGMLGLALVLALAGWAVCRGEEIHTVTLANGKTVKVICAGDVCKVVNPAADSILPLPPAANAQEKPSDEPRMDQDDEIDSLRRDLRQARKARIKSRGEYAGLLEKARAEAARAETAAKEARGKEADLRTQAAREEKLAVEQEAKIQRAFEAAYRKSYAGLESERSEDPPAESPKAAQAAKPLDVDGVRALYLITDTSKDQAGTWTCKWCLYQDQVLDFEKDFAARFAPVFSKVENGSPRAQQLYREHQVVNGQGQTVMSPGTPRWRVDTSSGRTYYRAGAMKIDDLNKWMKECTEAK